MDLTPFGANPAQHQTMVDGVPAWMRASLRAWYVSEFPVFNSRGARSTLGVQKLRRFDLATRQAPIADGLVSNGPAKHFESLSQTQVLQLLDWVISDTDLQTHPARVQEIERILPPSGESGPETVYPALRTASRRLPVVVQSARVARAPGDAPWPQSGARVVPVWVLGEIGREILA